MSHNFLLDLYAFIDDQRNRPPVAAPQTHDADNEQARAEGWASAWTDLRCYIDSQLFIKLPRRLQKKLAATGTPTHNGCRMPTA